MIHKDIPFGRPWIDVCERQEIMDVLDGHILTHGPRGKIFEEKFQNFIGGGHAVTTSSCMASLHLGSLYCGLKPGDEVIVPAQTHIATIHAVEIMGATPIFVDSELSTGNIDISKIETKITSKTKALSLVHFAGIPVEMDKVCALTQKYNLKTIEDCATTLGGFYKNKHVGLWGDIGCFSFYPVKHITTGEGGMLISKDQTIAHYLENFRAFSVDRQFTERKIPGIYDVNGVGLNYRMSELQAALGCTQMDKLPEILKRRKHNFQSLKKKFLTIEGIGVLDSLNEDITNSYYCLVALFDPPLDKKRNSILERLKEEKIGCSVYYPQPTPRMAYYNKKYQINPDEYKNAALISDSSIAFPVGPHLDEEDMHRIYEQLFKIIKEITR